MILESGIQRDGRIFSRSGGDEARRVAAAALAAILLHAGAVGLVAVEWPSADRAAPTEPSMVVELMLDPQEEEPAAEAESPPEPPPEPQPFRQSGGDPDLAQEAAAPPPEPVESSSVTEETATPARAPEASPPVELAAALPARKPVPPPKPKRAAPATVAPGEISGQGGGDRYLNQVRDEIVRQHDYPAVANPMRLSGTTHFEMTIDRSGRLLGLRMVRSSGVGTLDEVGVGMIRRAAPFSPVPDDIPGERIRLTLTLYLGP